MTSWCDKGSNDYTHSTRGTTGLPTLMCLVGKQWMLSTTGQFTTTVRGSKPSIAITMPDVQSALLRVVMSTTSWFNDTVTRRELLFENFFDNLEQVYNIHYSEVNMMYSYYICGWYTFCMLSLSVLLILCVLLLWKKQSSVSPTSSWKYTCISFSRKSQIGRPFIATKVYIAI